MSETVSEYLARIGADGGKSKSPAKLRAVTRNLQQAWKARRGKQTSKASRLGQEVRRA